MRYKKERKKKEKKISERIRQANEMKNKEM